MFPKDETDLFVADTSQDDDEDFDAADFFNEEGVTAE